MDDLTRDSSDEELSIPHLRLNAVTEALLADLDPTGTVPQDKKGSSHQRRNFGSRRDLGAKEKADIARERDGGGGFKDGNAAETVGGDKVSRGPKFTSLQKPPRRPRRLLQSEAEDAALERGEEGEEEPGFAPPGDRRRASYREQAEDEQIQSSPDDAFRRQPSPPMAVESPSSSSLEKPMRKVVISKPKHVAKTPSPPRQRPAPPPPTAANVPDVVAPAATVSADDDRSRAAPTKHRKIVVNGISYRILNKLGRGGSGRVYTVLSPDMKTWAFKAIPFASLDQRAIRQIRNEVALLQSLRASDRVAYLKDWCVAESKNAIHIIMELGQIDLENLIKKRMEQEKMFDPVFAAYYWREMLRCIAAIHAVDVVHSDIKPANFVSVNGVLKIVDFGIAHNLPDDTVNVYSDHQAGTPNYMAPETLKMLSSRSGHGGDPGSSSSRCVRFGKPSDMWSLGCVLHLMVYGRQPFAHIQGMGPKLMAIVDPTCVIELEKHGFGARRVPEAMLRTMEACLNRDPAKRPTAAGLLEGSEDGLLQRTDGGPWCHLHRPTGNAPAESGQIPASRKE